MKTHESLREDVSRMVEMQKKLDCSGGPENPANARLFEDYGNLRNSILEFFRLPYNFDHGWLCYARVTDTDSVVSRVMDRIIFGAVVYKNECAEEALTKLQIPIHTYTLFVYNEILLKEKDTVSKVYDALMKAHDPKNLEYLSTITTVLDLTPAYHHMIDYLVEKEIAYLKEYVITLRAQLKERVELRAMLASEER